MNMGSNIRVSATVVAKPDKAEETFEGLKGLLAPSRAESACIQYDLHRDPEDPAVFFFFEEWTSKEDLDIHLQTPHLKAFGAKAEALLACPPEVKIWKQVG